MKERMISQKQLTLLETELYKEEKSEATIEKYLRDTKAFVAFVNGEEITKELVISYKQKLMNDGYAVRSINSMLASLNKLFSVLGWHDFKIKELKLQKEVFR